MAAVNLLLQSVHGHLEFSNGMLLAKLKIAERLLQAISFGLFYSAFKPSPELTSLFCVSYIPAPQRFACASPAGCVQKPLA
jgi:hypothetical protein